MYVSPNESYAVYTKSNQDNSGSIMFIKPDTSFALQPNLR